MIRILVEELKKAAPLGDKGTLRIFTSHDLGSQSIDVDLNQRRESVDINIGNPPLSSHSTMSRDLGSQTINMDLNQVRKSVDINIGNTPLSGHSTIGFELLIKTPIGLSDGSIVSGNPFMGEHIHFLIGDPSSVKNVKIVNSFPGFGYNPVDEGLISYSVELDGCMISMSDAQREIVNPSSIANNFYKEIDSIEDWVNPVCKHMQCMSYVTPYDKITLPYFAFIWDNVKSSPIKYWNEMARWAILLHGYTPETFEKADLKEHRVLAAFNTLISMYSRGIPYMSDEAIGEHGERIPDEEQVNCRNTQSGDCEDMAASIISNFKEMREIASPTGNPNASPSLKKLALVSLKYHACLAVVAAGSFKAGMILSNDESAFACHCAGFLIPIEDGIPIQCLEGTAPMIPFLDPSRDENEICEAIQLSGKLPYASLIRCPQDFYKYINCLMVYEPLYRKTGQGTCFAYFPVKKNTDGTYQGAGCDYKSFMTGAFSLYEAITLTSNEEKDIRSITDTLPPTEPITLPTTPPIETGYPAISVDGFSRPYVEYWLLVNQWKTFLENIKKFDPRALYIEASYIPVGLRPCIVVRIFPRVT